MFRGSQWFAHAQNVAPSRACVHECLAAQSRSFLFATESLSENLCSRGPGFNDSSIENRFGSGSFQGQFNNIFESVTVGILLEALQFLFVIGI